MDGDRSLAHSRSHALDVTCTHIAHCKHTGKTCLQHVGSTRLRWSGVSVCRIQIPPGEDEPLVVQSEASLKPLGSRRCTGHDEYVTNVVDGSLTGGFV